MLGIGDEFDTGMLVKPAAVETAILTNRNPSEFLSRF